MPARNYTLACMHTKHVAAAHLARQQQPEQPLRQRLAALLCGGQQFLPQAHASQAAVITHQLHQRLTVLKQVTVCGRACSSGML